MPITQSRLFDLLCAAEKYQEHLQFLTDIIVQESRMALMGQQSHRTALANISISLNAINIQDEKTTIAVERVRWNLTNRRNLTDKDKKAAKRMIESGGLRRAYTTRQPPLRAQGPSAPPNPSGRTDAEIAAEIDREEIVADLDALGDGPGAEALPHTDRAFDPFASAADPFASAGSKLSAAERAAIDQAVLETLRREEGGAGG